MCARSSGSSRTAAPARAARARPSRGGRGRGRAANSASGVGPAAMEMLDRNTIRAVNAAFDVHLSEDAGSMLLVEVEGLQEETETATAAIVALCEAEGAMGVRVAETAVERDLLWKARKLGYPALARI